MFKINGKYLITLTGLLVLMILILPLEAYAQCPMCRIAAESNLKDGGTAGRGLNTGILYMLAAPYLLVGTIGYIWWKNHKKMKK